MNFKITHFFRIQQRRVSFLLLCAGLFSFLFIHNSFAKNPEPEKLPVLDRIVAVVNRDAIPESELNRQLQVLLMRLRQSDMNLPSEAILKKQLLEKMILEKLQLQMAKEANIEVDDETLNKAIDDIAKRDNLSQHQMQKILEDQGVSFPQFRESIKTEMIISKFQQREIAPHIHISKSEVEQFLKSPAGLDQSGTEYRVGHILISLPETPSPDKLQAAQKKAEDIIKKLNNGGDFGEIAVANSAGTQALNGGDLGFRKATELPTLFAKAIPPLTKGQVIGPLRNGSGFHIVKLLDKRMGGENTDLNVAKDESRNKAMDLIFQRRFEERLAIWLRRVRDDAEVQIYLNEQ